MQREWLAFSEDIAYDRHSTIDNKVLQKHHYAKKKERPAMNWSVSFSISYVKAQYSELQNDWEEIFSRCEWVKMT